MKQHFPTFDFRQPDNFIADGRPAYESFMNETDPLEAASLSDSDFLKRGVDQIEAKVSELSSVFCLLSECSRSLRGGGWVGDLGLP